MPRTVTGRTRLAELKRHLQRISRSWSSAQYDSLIGLFVRLLPRTLDAERCGIFVVEPDTDRIVSKTGTKLGDGEIIAPQESVVGRVIRTGIPAIENDLAARDGFHREIAQQTGFHTHSLVCVPVRRPSDEAIIGAIQVLNREAGGEFGAPDRELLEKVAELLAQAIENARLNHELITVSRRLERELSTRSLIYDDDEFVAQCPGMRELVDRAYVVGELPVSVLVQGENGTGKERIARMVHNQSERSEGPFVAVNCASIPESLVESEFFGYEKGAFTGASRSRGGRLEEAERGTLFLDEIGDLPMVIQPKLLRVLQEGEGRRLGSSHVRRYDFRLVSATNRDLKSMVVEGTFREDLYYRLFSVELTLPPLRARGGDIMRLAHGFLHTTCRRFGKSIDGFSPEVVSLFESYDWPGNVRQLRNEVERLVAFTRADQKAEIKSCSRELFEASGGLSLDDATERSADTTLPERVQALERELIREALEASGGNRERAARQLGISRQGLYKKLARYDLK